MTTESDPAAGSDCLDELLENRQSTHGDYQRLATVHCDLVRIIELAHGGRRFSSDVALSLTMIMLKVARISCGDAEFRDHWDDIAGYARLISDRLKKEGA